jgi:uncharacterized protein (TIGR02996 family)
MEVLAAYLCSLGRSVSKHDQIELVLRGSYLLKHWFGAHARPAADIDIECFERVRSATYTRFGTPTNYARALCMYAAQSWAYLLPEFEDSSIPDDGTSLWEYGTPGERCYTGWSKASDGTSGLLQIDIAQAGAYDMAFVSVEDLELADSKGNRSTLPAYTPEMLLAAKLSWIARGLTHLDAASAPRWRGEFKDLFDAHLLVTKGELRAHEFEKAMWAVAAEDKLEWRILEMLLTERPTLTDADNSIWAEFQQAYSDQVTCGPDEMLRAIVEHLRPWLLDLLAHAPFLAAIKAEPTDEVPYLIYADWLQERADPRGDFLRLFIQWYFRNENTQAASPAYQILRHMAKRLFAISEPSKTPNDATKELKVAVSAMSTPWLYHVFGSADRFREIKKRIEA